MNRIIIIFFPDTKESEDFIQILDSFKANYYLIGKLKWFESLSKNDSINSIKIDSKSFNFELLKNIIEEIIKNCDDSTEFKLIGFNESSIELIGKLNNYFSLDGIGESKALLFRDKWLMYNKLKTTTLNLPRTETVDKIDSFFSNFESPNGYIIKPRKKHSSIGIKKFSSKHDCFQWKKENDDLSSEYLIQEFIPGNVHFIDGVIKNGHLLDFYCAKNLSDLFLVGKTYKSFLKTMYLSQDSEIAQRLMKLHNQIVSRFDLKDSCTHIEFIVKPNLEIFFCEAAARPPSAGVSNLHKIQRGKSTIEIFGKSIFQDIKSKNLKKRDEIIPGLIGFTPHGKVKSFSSMNNFNQNWIVEKYQNPNIKAIEGGSFTQEIGRIYLLADNEKDCIQRIEKLEQEFEYEII